MYGKYSVTFEVLESSLNCIEVGIMPQDFEPIENKICNRSIGFHYANGKIHDTNGDREKEKTKWRLARAPTDPGSVGTIEMLVNVDEQLIVWKF